MARGVDLWAAQLVLKQAKEIPGIKLICAVPYEGFEKKWSTRWKQCYYAILAAATDIKVFYPAFSYASFQERNCWMVDQSDRVIAVYGGGRGGTYNTLAYAKRQKVEVRIIQG